VNVWTCERFFRTSNTIPLSLHAALAAKHGTAPDGLDSFSKERFTARWRRVVDDVFVR